MPTDLADVLLVAATKMESKAVLDVFQSPEQPVRAVEIGGQTYFDLGIYRGRAHISNAAGSGIGRRSDIGIKKESG